MALSRNSSFVPKSRTSSGATTPSKSATPPSAVPGATLVRQVEVSVTDYINNSTVTTKYKSDLVIVNANSACFHLRALPNVLFSYLPFNGMLPYGFVLPRARSAQFQGSPLCSPVPSMGNSPAASQNVSPRTIIGEFVEPTLPVLPEEGELFSHLTCVYNLCVIGSRGVCSDYCIRMCCSGAFEMIGCVA
jgi:hypothetical protein